MSLSIDVEKYERKDNELKSLSKILKIIEKKGYRTTLFVTGEFFESNKEIIEEAYSRGHEIGNHSMQHKKFFHMEEKKVEHDIKLSTKILSEVCKPIGFRAPCCSFVSFLPKILKRFKYLYDSSIMHSIKQPNLKYPLSIFKFDNGLIEVPFSTSFVLSMDWRTIKYWPIFKIFTALRNRELIITNVHSWSNDFKMVEWIVKKFDIKPIKDILDLKSEQIR